MVSNLSISQSPGGPVKLQITKFFLQKSESVGLRWSLRNSIKFPGDADDACPHKEPQRAIHIYTELTVESSLGFPAALWILIKRGFTQNIKTEVKREDEYQAI